MKGSSLEVKIGVQHAPRELTVDTESSSEEVLESLRNALQGDSEMFMLSDAKGRTVAVPSDKLAYIYFSAEGTGRVGFGPV